MHPFPRRRASDTAALAYSEAQAVHGSAQQVTISAPDKVKLKAWYLTPQNSDGRTVIACHGVADSGFGVMGDALLFLRSGYAVLVPDSRGHGESGGFVTYGVLESDDIALWANWLAANHPGPLYGFGESLGGAILIESLSKRISFRAVVAESPYASFEQVAEERVAKYGGVPRPLAKLLVQEAVLYARIRYHVNLARARPVAAVRESTTSLLLIHGLDDKETYPQHSGEIFRNAKNAQLWLVPGAKHTGAYAAAPKEFERRILAFFAQH